MCSSRREYGAAAVRARSISDSSSSLLRRRSLSERPPSEFRLTPNRSSAGSLRCSTVPSPSSHSTQVASPSRTWLSSGGVARAWPRSSAATVTLRRRAADGALALLAVARLRRGPGRRRRRPQVRPYCARFAHSSLPHVDHAWFAEHLRLALRIDDLRPERVGTALEARERVFERGWVALDQIAIEVQTHPVAGDELGFRADPDRY